MKVKKEQIEQVEGKGEGGEGGCDQILRDRFAFGGRERGNLD